MEINVSFSTLKIGKSYDRNVLTNLWGYKGRQAISRGVVTPANSNIIVLFVTKEKQRSSVQYVDYISDGFLYWEGEESGANNKRIIEANANNHTIHLLYRYRHHTDFIYMGLIKLVSHIEVVKAPYKFIFQILPQTDAGINILNEPLVPYVRSDKETEKQSMSLSRVGQGKYRIDLLNMWGACAITDVNVPEILKASHIKPWKDSDNFERLDPYNGLILTPTLDSLFDRGFISFENNGQILLSKEVDIYSKQLNISANMRLKKHFENNNRYLEYHRDEIYLKKFNRNILK